MCVWGGGVSVKGGRRYIKPQTQVDPLVISNPRIQWDSKRQYAFNVISQKKGLFLKSSTI